MIDVKRIGRRIAEERKLVRHLSQEQMVEAMYGKLGVHWSQPDLSNIERACPAVWDLSKLDKIADFFEIPLQNLLFGSGMEERMAHYYGRRMEIRDLSREKPVKAHVRLMNAATGAKTFCENSIPHYGWGPYRVYALIEPLQMGKASDPCGPLRFERFRLYAFFEDGRDSMVGVMRGAMAPVFALMNMAHLGRLQSVVPPPVLDVVDPARRLNPWLALMMFAPTPEERAVHEAGFFGRLERLREHSGQPVYFIESVYVREDCRRQGMCRLMLDVLEYMFGQHAAWLNLEPTDGSEMEGDCPASGPEYTPSEIGQLSLNASIAERLGFLIDPELWTRRVAVGDGAGGTRLEERRVRKCAYKLPDYLREIVKDDGDLVERGRALQSEAQKAGKAWGAMAGRVLDGEGQEEGQEEAASGFGVDSAIRHGAFISEAWYVLPNGARRYCAVVKPKRGKPWCGVAEKSFLEHGLDIDVLARYAAAARAPEGARRKALELAELHCQGFRPEGPVPAEDFRQFLRSRRREDGRRS